MTYGILHDTLARNMVRFALFSRWDTTRAGYWVHKTRQTNHPPCTMRILSDPYALLSELSQIFYLTSVYPRVHRLPNSSRSLRVVRGLKCFRFREQEGGVFSRHSPFDCHLPPKRDRYLKASLLLFSRLDEPHQHGRYFGAGRFALGVKGISTINDTMFSLPIVLCRSACNVLVAEAPVHHQTVRRVLELPQEPEQCIELLNNYANFLAHFAIYTRIIIRDLGHLGFVLEMLSLKTQLPSLILYHKLP